MLRSQKLSIKRDEVVSRLNELNGVDEPDDEQRQQMLDLPDELENLRAQIKTAIVTEDAEREKNAPEDSQRRERRSLIAAYDCAAVYRHMVENSPLNGPTAEMAQELRSEGGYRGIPMPVECLLSRDELQTRDDTVTSGVPSPVSTAPPIDAIFADTVFAAMGVRTVSVAQGSRVVPVATQGAAPDHQETEGGNVTATTPAFQTTDVTLSPEHHVAATFDITRQAKLQAGPSLDAAIRRNLRASIAQQLEASVFTGSGANGEPTGVVNVGGIPTTAVDAAPTFSTFVDAAVQFMLANAISSPAQVRMLLRPETYGKLDGSFITGTAQTVWDKLVQRFPRIASSSNTLPAPAGSPLSESALLTTTVNGVSPIWVATWSGLDLIVDRFTAARQAKEQLTGILSYDTAISRNVQVRLLTGLE